MTPAAKRRRKVAWAAVKNSYEKGDDDKWHKKNNR